MTTSCFGFFYCYSTSEHFVPHAEAVLQKECPPPPPPPHQHLHNLDHHFPDDSQCQHHISSRKCSLSSFLEFLFLTQPVAIEIAQQYDFQEKVRHDEKLSEGARGEEEEGTATGLHQGETCARVAGLVGLRFSKRCYISGIVEGSKTVFILPAKEQNADNCESRSKSELANRSTPFNIHNMVDHHSANNKNMGNINNGNIDFM